MTTAVIGAGLAGLMAAQRVRTLHPNEPVVIIERAPRVGGLLAGTGPDEDGVTFDLGTHIFQECGDPAIDDALRGAIPASELIHFPVGQGDLAASIFGGRLQSGSHFPDLREHPERAALRDALLAHAATHAPGAIRALDRLAPLTQTAAARFGATLAERVIVPVARALYGLDASQADDLAGFAVLLPGLTRAVVDPHETWLAHADDENYRALVAVPDQRALPARFRHGRRSYYARRGGSGAFTEGLAAQLKNAGVEILCGAEITVLDVARGSVTLRLANGADRTVHADTIVLATGAVGAARLLGLDLAPLSFDAPLPLVLLHVLLDAPGASDLCYLYDADGTAGFYRATHYRGFSGDPADRRLTFELVGAAAQHAQRAAPGDARAIAAPIVERLQALGLLEDAGIARATMQTPAAGFPTPTVKNLRALAALGAQLTRDLPPHVTLGGVGARPGLFFQNEVVADLVQRVS